VEIGAHTERHPNLNLLPGDEATQEMTRSRSILEQALDVPVAGFAYPGGRMNQDVIDRARNAGFQYAMSTVSSLNVLPCDPYALGRVGMPDAGVADFKRSLYSIAQRSVGRP
jgi:peptidoglycan/xylan/chitin deacetylase (PgdA/CDA1 family)